MMPSFIHNINTYISVASTSGASTSVAFSSATPPPTPNDRDSFVGENMAVTSAMASSVPKPTNTDKSIDDEWNQPVVGGWGQPKATTDIIAGWHQIADPNAEVRANGVGSGNLHRQGRNYKPDEIEILQRKDKRMPKGERKGTDEQRPLLIGDNRKKGRNTKAIKESKWGRHPNLDSATKKAKKSSLVEDENDDDLQE
ncbi:hypothetical protein BC937DRAFT_87245, partial [Endogone sp. FLAS-F59071]